jgi:hypothetical protein
MMTQKKTPASQAELEKYKLEGIIEPSALPVNTKIFIATTAKIFEFTILGGGRCMVRSSGKTFVKDQPCQIIGSLTKDGTLFADMIIRDKHLVMALPKGRYVTGLIRAASLQGPGWSYEMWQTGNGFTGVCGTSK